jgi:peptide/nickel transport system substrate-binding protein/oligopeptide transport system substrate-binding protein
MGRTVLAWVLLTASLAGCDLIGGSGPRADGVVRVAIAEPRHLVPANTDDPGGLQVLSALFTPLAAGDVVDQPADVAAERVETADNRVWTIRLRDNLTFHNGEKVTADSYLDAWNFAAYGPNGQLNNYLFERIEGYAAPTSTRLSGLRKVDDRTFTVTLVQPYREFRALLGTTAYYPLPRAAFDATGAVSPQYERAPIGNGPFAMKGTWQRGSKVEVVRYAAYPGPKPQIGGVEFRIYPQLDTAYADLAAGRLDVLATIPPGKLGAARDKLGDRLGHSPASSIQLLAFPAYDPALSRPEVRKAISMAIDREAIVRAVFQDSQQAATSFVAPVVAGYRGDTCGEACLFDAARARELYAAAGGPPALTISYNADGGHREWVEATCAQLARYLGVECAGQGEPRFADLVSKVERRQPVGTFRMGWVMQYPSMENYLGPLYSTSGSSNYTGYSNAEFDSLLRAGAAAATAEEAIRLYQAAEDLLARDLPMLPMRYGRNNYGHSVRVRNVEVDPVHRVNLLKLEYVH